MTTALAPGPHLYDRYQRRPGDAPRRPCRPRVRPHFDTRRDLAYPPYEGVTLSFRCSSEGDVDARVRVRILRFKRKHPPAALLARCAAAGPVLADCRSLASRARAWRWSRRFAAMRWCGCGSTPPVGARPCPRCVVVSMAAARSGDRGQYRRRLPALQQVVQLFYSGHDL